MKKQLLYISSKSFLKSLVFIVLVCNCGFARQSASNQKSQLYKPREIYIKGLAENNYLSPMFQLQRREAEYLNSPQMRQSYLEYITLLYSYIGDMKSAYASEEIFLADLEPRNKTRANYAKDITISPLAGYAPQPARDVIAAAAGEQQIIIINEEHRTPVHRALTHRLLAALYAKGFRYLAVETLREDDTDLNKRGYPTGKSGYYTFDPVFGDVIRQAIRTGFKVVAYEAEQPCPKPEDFLACQNYREFTQAQNIYDRILKNDPKAKILIQAGRGHASKVKEEDGLVYMARNLWTISGIEPFTVDQVHYSERNNRIDETPLYRYAVSKSLLLPEPTVFASPKGKFFTDLEGYDLRVFTPPTKYISNRPEWLQLGGARKSYKLNLKKLKLSARGNLFMGASPILVQAFFSGESADAIPVDQAILYPNQEIPALMLPVGNLRIRAVNEKGETINHYQK